MNAIFWLALMVIFLIVEASTVVMISLWFAVGSLAALVVAVTGGPVGLQVATALVVSGALLAALRPMVRKHFTPKLQRTNVDAIIGSQGYVTADIDNVAATGSVKLGAMEWTARSTTGVPVPKGTLVKVDRIEGVKAFVTPVAVREDSPAEV
jgi:membrane protein implicated in regulation of membrane protease activity